MRTQGTLFENFIRLIRGLLKAKQICFIGKGVKLGKGVKIGPLTLIEDNCQIGNRSFIGFCCMLRPNVIVGEDSSISHLSFVAERCKIGNRVSIHTQCHLSRDTIVEDDVFISFLSWTSNIKKIVYRRDKEVVSSPPIIRRGARVASQVGIIPGTEIGENSIVGAGSLITKKVPPKEVWFGSPATKRGETPIDEEI